MSVEVKVGQVINPRDIKCGQGKSGQWAFGLVKADKGYDSCQVWFTNGDDYKEMHSFKVVRIDSVKKSARKVKDKDGNDKWVDTYSINAFMEMVDEDAPSGFASLDEGIPF